jgi:hypothetical protein
MDIVEKTKVKLLQRVDLSQTSNLDNFEARDDTIILEPGEAYQCAYKIKAQPNRSADAGLDAENEITVSKTMKEIEQFAEFSFAWFSASNLNSEASIKKTPIIC